MGRALGDGALASLSAGFPRAPSVLWRRVDISGGTRRNPVGLALAMPGKDNLASDFMRFVNTSGHSWPLENRKPTPLMPPSTVVKAQMDALMRNDWPEEDSGIKTAFDFAMRPLPYQYDEIPDDKPRARAWDASARVLTCQEFIESFKYTSYVPMVNCLDWKVLSPMVFRGERRAVQAIEVRFKTTTGETRTAAFTFSLQRVMLFGLMSHFLTNEYNHRRSSMVLIKTAGW
ncbi:uncharacterized protein LOC9639502 isoform X2 [Selaginella moellendorffii]|uniref:uncharacterized protein LOC9639502 isoform X2 n=1 Tax=Selaginella moellendorffii TaxID=88036 RepID=UPI000D1C978C|nr:uncharacterized protein LOC9639502 isoform X2 [Selaginella moellendorffii]|eukprot:XP_024520879.1 uncharacterized protein LOC9639502 isoform X2 [Selaginella moellendorffii]